MTEPVAWAESISNGAFNNSCLNLCLIDADVHGCRFPQILKALHAQQAETPTSENVFFLVNYSMASQEVRNAITSLFTASMHTGALADLRLVKHKEAVHRCDELSSAWMRETDDDKGLGSFQAFYRGPSFRAQCIQLSLHRPLEFEGLQFGALYCLLQVELTIAPGRCRNVSFLW